MPGHDGTKREGSSSGLDTSSIDRHIAAVAPAVGGGYVFAAGPGVLFIDDSGSMHELT